MNGRRSTDAASWSAQLANVAALNSELQAKRDEVRRGWGPEYESRVRKKGKLPTWERIELLKDGDSPILAVGTLVNYGRTFGDEKKTSPGAGVVTAFVRVEGRWVVVIANDNTVASGSWWPQTPEKIQRAQEIALRLRLPVVYLVDCSGLFLPEQAHTFPGRTGAGAIFKMNALLSAARRPADRRRSRRLHRRRRLHADHLGHRLHDRAGVHGGRGRGARERRKIAAHHVAVDRRPGRPRPSVPLRRPSRPGRRDAHPLPSLRGRKAAGLGLRLLPLRRRSRRAALSRRGLGRAVPRRSQAELRRLRDSGTARRPLAVRGVPPRRRAGDDLRRGPRGRPLRRVRRQQPRAHRSSGKRRAQASGRDPVPGGDREDLAVLALLQRRRHPRGLAPRHLGVRHRTRSGKAGTLRVRLEPDLHQQHEHGADVHGAPPQGQRGGVLRDARASRTGPSSSSRRPWRGSP